MRAAGRRYFVQIREPRSKLRAQCASQKSREKVLHIGSQKVQCDSHTRSEAVVGAAAQSLAQDRVVLQTLKAIARQGELGLAARFLRVEPGL